MNKVFGNFSFRTRRHNISQKKMIITRVTLILLSVIIIATAIIVYQLKSKVDKMIISDTNIIETEDDPGQSQLDKDNRLARDSKKDIYVLVMGLDYRDEHASLLTDSLMVLHLIPQESVIKILSIPRDLLVEDRNGSLVKMNSLFYEGYNLSREKAEEDPSLLSGDTVRLGAIQLDQAVLGGAMANTRDKIDELLDIEIDHMILVNFQTLISLVDEVGGIEIDVKRSMKYKETNLYLEPGRQILNGEEALGYARFRQDDRGNRYYISDFERGKNQQEVVKALADKILSWKNTTKVLKLLDIISDNVKTDIDYSDMYAMIKNYYSIFNSDSLISLPFPEYYSSKGDVIIPDEALDQLRDSFHSHQVVETDIASE